jgi:hypothetical protein
MADINDFLGRVLSGGLQRTNRYRCTLDLANLNIAFPPRLQEAVALLREGLLCRTTSTPTRTLETTTVNLAGGYDETYAVGTTYNNLDCTFLCPLIGDPGSLDHVATNPVLSVFHGWQNLIQNRGTSGEDADMVLTFPSQYRLEQGMRLEMFTGKDRSPIVRAAAAADEAFEQLTSLGHDFSAIDFKGRDSARYKPGISTAFDYFDVYPMTVSGTTVEWDMRDEMMEVAVSFSYTHWQQVKDETLNL